MNNGQDPTDDPERRECGKSFQVEDKQEEFVSPGISVRECDDRTVIEGHDRTGMNLPSTDYIPDKEEMEAKFRSRIPDPVNHPDHYNDRIYKGEKIEAIDLIEIYIQNEKNPAVAYNMSNVLKYLLRFRTKGKDLEDSRKAMWYLKRMIMHVGLEFTSPDGG